MDFLLSIDIVQEGTVVSSAPTVAKEGRTVLIGAIRSVDPAVVQRDVIDGLHSQ